MRSRQVPVSAIINGEYPQVGMGTFDERSQSIEVTFNQKTLDMLKNAMAPVIVINNSRPENVAAWAN